MSKTVSIYVFSSIFNVLVLAFSYSKFFLILYKELYFRDLYTRSQRGPSLQYRYGSYVNYQELFSLVLYQDNTPIRAQLPNLVGFSLIKTRYD
jgi:hypothetical protein